VDAVSRKKVRDLYREERARLLAERGQPQTVEV
jgi:hypothetical protein